MHCYLYAVAWRVRGGWRQKLRGERAGGNKDEGIGVGGWTIRRGHPMKPSAVQGIVDIPYHGEVLLEMARGKSEAATKEEGEGRTREWKSVRSFGHDPQDRSLL